MSQEESEDVKPKLNLIINYEGQHITVKVKPNMPFRKIFAAAEVRDAATPRAHPFCTGTFRFAFEGKRLGLEDTPAETGMEDNDMIDAHIQQV
ncbi:hypothetical protein OG21DRAFT_1374411, partial [Imleria badia]